MTSPDPAATLAQINAAREQTYQNIALAQGILTQANQAAAAAAQDRAAIQAIAQQTVRVDTSVGTRVFAGDTMIHGDTGWRDVTSLIAVPAENMNASHAEIRRENGTVYLTFDRFTLASEVPPTSGSYITLMDLPTGFDPGSNPFRIGEGGTYELGARLFTMGTSLNIIGSLGAGGRRFYVSWMTSRPWPTSLPGIPG